MLQPQPNHLPRVWFSSAFSPRIAKPQLPRQGHSWLRRLHRTGVLCPRERQCPGQLEEVKTSRNQRGLGVRLKDEHEEKARVDMVKDRLVQDSTAVPWQVHAACK